MVYHAYNKSIADYVIFNDKSEYSRIVKAMYYYQVDRPSVSYSGFMSSCEIDSKDWMKTINLNEKDVLVDIIAYCIMPTHIHLVLKEVKEGGVPIFISNTLNSYTRYFNLKHGRKGPLWEGRTKKVLVKTDEQLLHLTRYVHLNPVTAFLVNNPIDWPFSSFGEYMGTVPEQQRVCRYYGMIDSAPDKYRRFVESGIEYQRDLAKIKALLFD